MPKRKRRHGPKRRRSRKRFKSRRRRRRRIPRGVLTSNKIIATHNYVEKVILNQTSLATPVHYSYRCNSVYDPNYTGIGHQPYLYDQYKQFYENVTVLRSKITVTFIGDSETSDDSDKGHLEVGVFRSADQDEIVADPQTTVTTRIEGGKTKVALLNSSNHGSKHLSLTWSAKKHTDTKKDDNTGTTGNGDGAEGGPSESHFFTVWARAINDLAVGNDVTCLIRIKYTCLYENPVTVTQS